MSKLYSQGATGADVKEIQAALNYHIRKPATPLSPDGIFGPLTADRVREFQKKAGLVVDGIVGPNTLSALYARVAGVTEIHLTPIKSAAGSGASAPGGPRRHPLLPTVGVPLGGLPLGPVRTPPARPPMGPQPAPDKAQTKTSKSHGFDLKSKIVFDPLADDKKTPKWKYTFTLTQELPWPILLPKPAKLSFDVKSAPLTAEYSMSGKLKVPFREFKLPPSVFAKSGTLTPYFYTGAGVKQNGFDKFSYGVGTELKVKLIDMPHRPWVPTVSLSADGGLKHVITPKEPYMEIKGFFQTSALVEWHIPAL